MKQLLILLLVTSTAYGQKNTAFYDSLIKYGTTTTSIWATTAAPLTTFWWILVSGKSGHTSYGQKIQYSDTLEIMEPIQIHFIKIGNEVYQLVPHNTTIEMVKETSYWNNIFSNDPRFNLTPLTTPN